MQRSKEERVAWLMSATRCGAKTRSGDPCRSPTVKGKKRCRMHGGARESGAPKGNRNAFRHGLFTGDAITERKRIEKLLADTRQLLREVK